MIFIDDVAVFYQPGILEVQKVDRMVSKHLIELTYSPFKLFNSSAAFQLFWISTFGWEVGKTNESNC